MKNIILLITDTFRYDNLFDRARRPVRTPELDRFTAMATAIESFYMGSFPTIPHRTDLATGRLGWPHYGWQPIDLSSRNHIASALGGAGYATQLICDTPHLFNSRFQHAFHAAYQHRGQEGDTPALHLNDDIIDVLPAAKDRDQKMYRGISLADKHRWTNRYSRYEGEMFACKTAQSGMRWLEENDRGAAPFFLWLDFFDPHEPWDPPEYLVRRYDPDYDGTPMIHPNYGPSAAYTAAELHNLWAHYAAEAELVDRWIGRVLQKVDDLQLWDDTVVVVMADHGMSLGEHARCGKSNICDSDPRYWPTYPEIGHVPVLMAGAGIPQGVSLDLMAQPIDMLPTLADLAGVELSLPEPVHGKSFAAAVRSGQGSHREVVVTGAHVEGADGARPRRCSTPFVVTKDWGYAPVGAAGRRELYRLAEDPLAEHDVAAANAEVCSEMHAHLMAHLQAHHADDECLALWDSSAPGGDEGSWAIDYQ